MLRLTLVAVLAVAVAASGAWAACSDFHDCGDCTTVLSCGWCSATQKCLPGNAAGPSDGTQCLGAAWHKGAGTCTDCTKIKSCKQCADYEADCSWCSAQAGTGGSCHPINATILGCTFTNQCDCSLFGECSDCLDRNPHCGWCDETNACVPKGEASMCAGGTIRETQCPCSTYNDCTSCAGDSACVFCEDGTLSGGTCKDLGSPEAEDCNAPLSCDAFCNAAAGCDACLERNGCAYCSNTKQCVDIAFSHGSCMTQHTCPVQCGAYTNCEACDASACTWCGSEGLCKMKESDSCKDSFWTHTCDTQNQGAQCDFNAGSFVGGMFTIIGIIIIGAIAYFVYRWKSGSRITYRELSG